MYVCMDFFSNMGVCMGYSESVEPLALVAKFTARRAPSPRMLNGIIMAIVNGQLGGLLPQEAGESLCPWARFWSRISFRL